MKNLAINLQPLIYGAFPVCRNYTVRAFVRRQFSAGGRQPEDRAGKPRSRDSGVHAGRLRPRDRAHETRLREPHGNIVSEREKDGLSLIRGKHRGKQRFAAKKMPRKRSVFKAFSLARKERFELSLAF